MNDHVTPRELHAIGLRLAALERQVSVLLAAPCPVDPPPAKPPARPAAEPKSEADAKAICKLRVDVRRLQAEVRQRDRDVAAQRAVIIEKDKELSHLKVFYDSAVSSHRKDNEEWHKSQRDAARALDAAAGERMRLQSTFAFLMHLAGECRSVVEIAKVSVTQQGYIVLGQESLQGIVEALKRIDSAQDIADMVAMLR